MAAMLLAHNEGKAVVFEASAENEALAVQTKLQQAGLTTEMQRMGGVSGSEDIPQTRLRPAPAVQLLIAPIFDMCRDGCIGVAVATAAIQFSQVADVDITHHHMKCPA